MFLLHMKARSLIILFIILSFTLLFCNLASAEGNLPVPDADSRSLIVGVNTPFIADKTDGSAALTKMIGEGKRIAMKKIGAELAKLKDASPHLDFELVKTPTGFLNVLKKAEIPGRNKGEPSFLWIETESRFIVKCDKDGKRPETKTLDKANLLDVRIWTEKKDYSEGQKIVLYLRGNRNFYGKIIRIDAQGNVCQILPNNYRQISFLEKDRRYIIPDEGDRYELKSQPPFGTIRFVAYASRLPMSQVNLKTITGGIFQYRGLEKSFHNSVKHIIPVGEEQIAEFYNVFWEIKTVPNK
jgi:hypothetical protein